VTTTTQGHDLPPMPVDPVRTYKAQAYGALLVLIAVPVLCIAGNQAGLLRIVFPVLSVAVGGFLFWRSKPLYVGLVCWLWFVTPFLRRLADFQNGWAPTSPVLLAPYLTTGISAITLLTSLKSFGERKSLPYVCALVGIAYGTIIGLARFPLFSVLQAVLNWVVPVIFGFFIYQNRKLYRDFRHAIEQSFLCGILLTGAYGIFQFFNLPDWDRMWMLNVQLNSFGAVEALKVRVFSTMNAPAIFAAVTSCGLLLLFSLKGKLRILAAVCGFLALVLTMSRASWLSLVAGFIFLALQLDMRQRFRLAVVTAMCIVFLLASTQIPAVNDLVGERIRTVSDPSHDVSYTARIEGHQEAFRQLAQEPFGEGLGSTDTEHGTEGDDDFIGPHDSSILEFLYSLGWTGTLIYAMGLGAMGLQLMRSGRSDPFVLSSKAIIIGFVAQCLLNSVLLGVLGFMVWMFASMSLAQMDLAEQSAGEPEQQMTETAEYVAV
jgi:nitrate reductase NapE component